MVPRLNRPCQESAATLARALAGEECSEADAPVAPAPAVLLGAPGGGRLVWPYVAVLLAALAVVGATSSWHAAFSHVTVLFALVAGVVALDLVRIDVFERINLSPASVPALALAFLFGPVGPLLAELAIAGVRIARRVPGVKWAFDVGALGLAGAAAAAVWAAAAPTSVGAELAAGMLAAVAAYLVTSLLLPTVMWLARGEHPWRAWREQLAWLAPHYVGFGALAGAVVICERLLGPAGILVFAVPLLLLWIGEQQYLSRSRAGVQAVRERNDELEAANVRIRDLLERAHASYLQAITTLGHALQARDPEAAGRTERVSQLSRVIGEAMAMSEADQHALTIGVVVHDIGRVCLRRGESPQQVPRLSVQILDPLDLPPIVKQMARHHLERSDGLGAPDGLAGEAIPLAARILALADALDNLTTPTAARPALPLHEAMAELGQESGTRFCPLVFAALQHSLAGDPTLRRYFGERPGDGVPRAA